MPNMYTEHDLDEAFRAGAEEMRKLAAADCRVLADAENWSEDLNAETFKYAARRCAEEVERLPLPERNRSPAVEHVSRDLSPEDLDELPKGR